MLLVLIRVAILAVASAAQLFDTGIPSEGGHTKRVLQRSVNYFQASRSALYFHSFSFSFSLSLFLFLSFALSLSLCVWVWCSVAGCFWRFGDAWAGAWQPLSRVIVNVLVVSIYLVVWCAAFLRELGTRVPSSHSLASWS